jgi:hypothetical protein
MRHTYKSTDISSVSDFVSKNGKIPILLKAQPTHFSLLKDPEDLRAWEANVRAELGTSLSSVAESACESGSPSNDCDTD